MKKNNPNYSFNLNQLGKNRKNQPPQSIGQVYSMLSKQEEAITQLLRKYGEEDIIPNDQNSYPGFGLYEEYIKPRSQTIDTTNIGNIKLKLVLNKNQKPYSRQSSPTGRQTNLSISDQYRSLNAEKGNDRRTENQSVSLPIIYQKNKLGKSRRKQKNANQIMWNFKRDRARMQSQLYQIYGQKNSYFANEKKPVLKSSAAARPPKRIQKQKKSHSFKQQIYSRVINDDDKYNNQFGPEKVQDQKIESDDETEGEQIPTKHYQREFRDLMRGQCLEQLNFLYFSKNEKMKDWTEGLLSLIEKHDKEVMSVRKKSKYLHTFDDKFFSIGVFNTDDV